MVVTDVLNLYAVHQCHVNYGSIWYGLQFSYFGLLLGWGAYLAYRTRDIWAKYNYPNESRSILLSIYNISFCALILIPLVTALNASPDTLFFLITVATVFPTTFALVVVHGPKIMSFIGSSIRAKTSRNETTDKDIHSNHREPQSQTAKLLKPEEKSPSPEPTLKSPANLNTPEENLAIPEEERTDDPIDESGHIQIEMAARNIDWKVLQITPSPNDKPQVDH